RGAVATRRPLRFQITALLTAKQALEPATLEALALSSHRDNRWLATLTKPTQTRFAASAL
ncbi:MAG TPA: hypothetical protein VK993_00295, partial [Chthoniobacterales bacterium]|nr:hypothetical protein [Chthoniobacterales bacterium]